MNRTAKARHTLISDLTRIASIVRTHGADMGIDRDIRRDFARRCAAIVHLAEEDFDATMIGEPADPSMPMDADEDDDVLGMFNQDEFGQVQESYGHFSENEVTDRMARRISRRIAGYALRGE